MSAFVAAITVNALIGLGISIKDDDWISMALNAAIAGWGIFLLVTK